MRAVKADNVFAGIFVDDEVHQFIAHERRTGGGDVVRNLNAMDLFQKHNVS
jgi:hypothetical protein